MQDNCKNNPVTIIPASDSHVPEIVELWKEFMDFHKEIEPLYARAEDGHIIFERFVRGLIESEEALVLVALDEGSVVAYSICQIAKYPPVLCRKEYGFINDIAVKGTHRRRGIGGQLFGQMFEWFESRNLDRIELRVASANKIGYSFWTKHGFKDCKRTLYLEREKS